MLKPRRRRLPLIQLDNVSHSSQESRKGGEKNEKVKRKRKRRRKGNAKIARQILILCVLFSAGLVACIWILQLGFVEGGSSFLFRAQLRLAAWKSTPFIHLEHARLYDEVHRAYSMNRTSTPTYEKRPFTLSSKYGSKVMEQGCNVTVVFMDPRLATAGPGEAAWFSLESVAAFLPEACILLQTATCVVRSKLEEAQGFVNDAAVMNVVASHVYENALPLLRGMIENGLVRVTIPDHEKYDLKSCSDYGNPSSALINMRYWTDEFIEGVDDDLILFIQDDAVICHSFDIESYRDFAFVGAVWSKHSFQLKEGMCNGMPLRWSSWLSPQKRWERQQKRGPSTIAVEKRLPTPDYLLNTSFPNVCGEGVGPVGNGGLSLRSRSWAMKAIETCPHVKFSGVDMDEHVHACKVLEEINEDLYFGIVFRGIGAPLPMACEASLLATEMMWPEQVKEMFGAANGSEANVEKHLIHYDGNYITIPAAVHKPWWYHSNDLLRSDEMKGACPFLQYAFPREQSEKWREWQRVRMDETDGQHWKGIGS